ncbi:MAG TPA: threonine synthase, partial [Thermomicrobiales bacterium]|nr:threonine synthase [Thermomicrobiales bacterium]
SAASLAGLKQLVAAGAIAPDATVVCVLTGNMLKDADAIAAWHFADQDGAPRPGANRPLRVDATLPALERALADALHG